MSNTTAAPAIVTVTRGQGRAIHAAYLNSEGNPIGTWCNVNTLMGGRADGRIRRVAGEVTCKSCLKGMAPAPVAEELEESPYAAAEAAAAEGRTEEFLNARLDAERAPAAASYAAQTNRGAGWLTLAARHTAAAAAWTLTDDMQRAGLRFSELHDHRADLAAGHVLTADTGTAFRVIVRCDNPEAEHPGFSCDHPVTPAEPEEAAPVAEACTTYGCGRPFDPANRAAHWSAYGHMPTPEAPRPVGRPPVGPLRTVRVSDEVWSAASASAAARGESVSEVIRRALETYVNAFPADITPGVTR